MMKRLARPVMGTILVSAALAMSGCGIFKGKGGPKTPTVGDRVPILSRIESGAKVDPALAGVSVVLPPAEVNTDWAQAGGPANKAYGHLALGASPASHTSPRRLAMAAAPTGAGEPNGSPHAARTSCSNCPVALDRSLAW